MDKCAYILDVTEDAEPLRGNKHSTYETAGAQLLSRRTEHLSQLGSTLYISEKIALTFDSVKNEERATSKKSRPGNDAAVTSTDSAEPRYPHREGKIPVPSAINPLHRIRNDDEPVTNEPLKGEKAVQCRVEMDEEIKTLEMMVYLDLVIQPSQEKHCT